MFARMIYQNHAPYAIINLDGFVQRVDIALEKPTEHWRIAGAHTYNNFGNITRRWTLQEILENPQSIPWKHQNGKQKTHLLDYDHGTTRQWNNPTHYVK